MRASVHVGWQSVSPDDREVDQMSKTDHTDQVTDDPAPNSMTLASTRGALEHQLEELARRVAQLATPVEDLVTGDTGDKPAGHVGLAILGELAGITASLLLVRKDVEHLEDVAWRCGKAAGRHPAAQLSHVRVLHGV